ncbi:MAG TPA: ABC transporter substrate-binding protein [Pseudolabrys sp.]|nr:ABC transporter substrate-binding protein [Pseudolabrys sp.]
MVKRLVCAAAVLLVALAGARAENAKLNVIVFAGVQNLPLFAAQANGFYARRGLDVDIKFTPGSEELRNGLAQGRYQIAHTAIDNAFALKDKANVDIAVVLGGDNSFNHLMTQGDVGSLADLKGKTVAVDAVNTAYAFQLYKMLKQRGLNKGDYVVKPVGATGFRLDAMLKDKTIAAAIMNPPFSVRGGSAGLKDMGTVVAAIGPYQGTTAFVLRDWGKANADILVKYLQAYVEGWRWCFEPNNKEAAVALLAERLKLPADVARASFESTAKDFDRDGALNMAGVDNVLKLRAEFEGGEPKQAAGYLDLSYYKKALAGL